MGRGKGAEVQLFVLGRAQYKVELNIATTHSSLIMSATPQTKRAYRIKSARTYYNYNYLDIQALEYSFYSVPIASSLTARHLFMLDESAMPNDSAYLIFCGLREPLSLTRLFLSQKYEKVAELWRCKADTACFEICSRAACSDCKSSLVSTHHFLYRRIFL